ncbi:MAG TPA: SCO family protein [Verrucomicrobiae bacterium]|nr:SCO family protein [Verrucomicrobiae bacterium]
MKPKVILPILAAVTLFSVLSVATIHRRQQSKAEPVGTQTFHVRGQVRSVDVANKVVRITHEEIPDYMPAMTMPLNVKDVGVLAGLQPGDTVMFDLAVTDDDSWIARIEKVAGDEAQPAPKIHFKDLEMERVQAGELMPDFELVDQDGKKIHLKDFRGKAVVLTFIYTRCPLPNFCPLMSKNLSDLESRFSKDFPGKFQLLSVSMDPAFDTSEVLKSYAERYEADTKHWSFATGTEEQIQFLASLTGLTYEWENGLISHDLRTVLIGPDGRMVQVWKSNVWTPYEVHRSVAELLSPGKGSLTGKANTTARTTASK